MGVRLLVQAGGSTGSQDSMLPFVTLLHRQGQVICLMEDWQFISLPGIPW